MKEVKKGNKVPYNGYLLNKKEYEKYKKSLALAEEVGEFIKDYRKINPTYDTIYPKEY